MAGRRGSGHKAGAPPYAHGAEVANRIAAELRDAQTGVEDKPANREKVAHYLDKVRYMVPDVVPVGEGRFAGKLDPAVLPRADRCAWRLSRTPAGDWRNWEEIRRWTAAIRPLLLQAAMACD